MKIFPGILFMLTFSGCGGSAGIENSTGTNSSSATVQESNFPLVFESDSINLGTVYSDDELPFNFVFSNQGSAEILLPLEVHHEGNYMDIVHPGESLLQCGYLNFVYQFREAKKGETTSTITVMLKGKSKKLKVHFNYAGEGSKRPNTRSQSVFPAYFFKPDGEGKYKIEIFIPNHGDEKLHIRNISVEDKDIRYFLRTELFCETYYNTRYIQPGEDGILVLEADQAILDKGKNGMLGFTIKLNSNAGIPTLYIRYQVMPGS